MKTLLITALTLSTLTLLLGAAYVDAPAAGRAQDEADKPTLLDEAAEKRIRAVLAELDANRRGNMNVPEADGQLLFLLTRTMEAQNVVEIGTSNGYSGLWMLMALRSTGGHLKTYDIDPRRSELAKKNFEKAGVSDLVTQVLGDAHEKVLELKDPIDLLFIDADKPGYLDYLKKRRPLVRPGGLISAHNMKRPAPSPDYVEAITTDPDLETVFLNMDAAGIAVTMKKR